MKSLAEQMSFYHNYHKKKITKLTHLIGIPLAILPVLILFNWIDLYINGVVHIPLSWLTVALLMAYYFFLDWQLACVMTLAFIILNFIAIAIGGTNPHWHGLLAMIIIFIVAWGIQFIGHFFEGKRPALFDNFYQVLIAPIFIAAEIAFAVGKKKELKKQMLAFAVKNDGKN